MKSLAIRLFSDCSVPLADTYAFAYDSEGGFLGCVAPGPAIHNVPKFCCNLFNCAQLVWISKIDIPQALPIALKCLTDQGAALWPHPITIIDAIVLYEGRFYSAREGLLECPTS